jgi:hypothetical protein
MTDVTNSENQGAAGLPAAGEQLLKELTSAMPGRRAGAGRPGTREPRRHLHHLGRQPAARPGLQVLAHELTRAHRGGEDHRVLPSVPSQVPEG